MTEQKTNRTEEQLEQELRKSKGGKLSGKILSMLGVVIAVAGIILGGNLVLVVIGGVILGVAESFAAVAISIHMREPFVFMVLLLVLLLRPAGILGKVQRGRV